MGFAFLTPLILGGLSLLALPWILHQIRRPEREPHVFSSLMFVPNIKKEIIERRRLQHLLLMLLRMLVLLLLVFAFSRPALWSYIPLDVPDEAEWHVILLDTSYSMGAQNHFARAREEAIRILDDLRPGQSRLIVFVSLTISPGWREARHRVWYGANRKRNRVAPDRFAGGGQEMLMQVTKNHEVNRLWCCMIVIFRRCLNLIRGELSSIRFRRFLSCRNHITYAITDCVLRFARKDALIDQK